MQVGVLIQLLRTTTGMSQTELAAKAGISANYLSIVEQGHKQPSPKMVSSVAAAFDIDPESINYLMLEIPREMSRDQREKMLNTQASILGKILLNC